mgnify:CR=1 FL=1
MQKSKVVRTYSNEQGTYRDEVIVLGVRADIYTFLDYLDANGFDTLLDIPGAQEDTYIEQELVRVGDPNGSEEILQHTMLVLPA